MPQYQTNQPSQGGNDLAAPGEYQVRVVNATESTSSKGNPMIELECRILREDGSEGRKMYDHLVFVSNCFWKIDNFLAACGTHPGEGKTVSVEADDCIGQTFRARVGVEKDRKGNDQNVIEEYLYADGF